ncbi:electron transfer flavoprotein subunit alpha/FixB family protein [Parathalassolituus penaei]|uniref:Electron transfer flavoprotein subunit alpha/FixB family protein n=1 Tax=Parathalassolituus penaei TaxID=2997323 RepID=A0A9X3EGS5_9GAMM|nr:electron transfer flavoprotein subunit alpha/FixB family protein [Parathalassolituus penaei]MCY0967292.1 electron transfer flavoprotein subunit alpha/FixB family protein [Parathalassolituus penaei]
MSSIIRKDPRKNWILRNRLHPLHQQMLVAEGAGNNAVVRGPSGLIRKNPHNIGFIGPNGIKRIDRLGGSGTVVAAGQRGEAVDTRLPLVQISNPESWIVVVPDLAGGRLTSHDRDVLGQARQLAAANPACAVVALVFGDLSENLADDSNGLALAGVDRLLHFSGDDWNGYCPEQELAAMLAVHRQLLPQHWLFPDTHLSGNDRALRLATRLEERPAMHAWQIRDGRVTCRAGSERNDVTRSLPKVVALLAECAMPVDDSRHEVLPMALPELPGVLARIQDAGAVAVDPNQIAMAEAGFILSAGNGIHDWEQFHEAARVLGATEGASRVAVDDGFMPRFRQVGATGTWVTARVYVAVGISGAVQHLQGIGACEKVIAINTDAGCDMVKRADLSVIGDSQEILAALIEQVKALRQPAASEGGRHHVA